MRRKRPALVGGPVAATRPAVAPAASHSTNTQTERRKSIVFALVGCDSNSGGDASSVCDGCDSSSMKPACEQVYNVCVQDDAGSAEDCAVAALIACGVV